MRLGHIGWLVIVAALLGGCGPTEREVGQMMLLWAIPLAAITLGVERLYVRVAYRLVEPKPALTGELAGCIVVGVVVVWLVSLARGAGGTEHSGIVGIVLSLGYCGYLAFALVIAHHGRARWASTAAVTIPIALIVIPGLALALFGADTADVSSGLVWMLRPLLWLARSFVGLGLLVLAFAIAWISPHRPPPPIASARDVSRQG